MAQPYYDAYLDIETTGLSPFDNDITIVGIHLCNGADERFVQLIGDSITEANILAALDGGHTIYTYNGHRFDLPFIYSRLKVNLASLFKHHDLMFDCWRRNLYGGFKSVERQLGISRKLTEVNGYEAIRLWWRYYNNYDKEALNTLLEYNREDVMNLRCLREKLLSNS
jgi:uncharacterized protein YprB with RNaseH-like and TPR domain